MKRALPLDTLASALMLCLMLLTLPVSHVAAQTSDQVTGQMNCGGISSGVDPDGMRRSTNYAIVDSIGQFVVSASDSPAYRIEHGYWSSEVEIIVTDVLSQAKSYQDGKLLKVTGNVVTAGNNAFASRFYIEELDRSSGLQVRYGTAGGPPVTAGYGVDVTGRLTTIDGERVLEYPYVSVWSYDEPIPVPLLMFSRDAGGGSLNEYTPGVWRGMGTHNTGLLIRTYGRVVYRDLVGGFFYLDDGSSIDDGTGWGIRVICTGLAPGNTIALPGFNKFISVTGIISTTVVQSQVVRCMRPRMQTDIVIIR